MTHKITVNQREIYNTNSTMISYRTVIDKNNKAFSLSFESIYTILPFTSKWFKLIVFE